MNSFARVSSETGDWRLQKALHGKGVQSITADPSNADIVYIGTHSNGLWKSSNRGRTWQDMNLPETNVYSVAVSVADGTVYAGTEPSKLFKSVDGAESWEELSTLRSIPSAPRWSFPPRPWTSHVRWIAPNPRNPNLLLVGIEQGGVMYSDDGGQTWEDHRTGAIRDVHELAWHPEETSRAYEAAGGGSARSSDSGRTWQVKHNGLNHRYVWALAVDPDDADTWYVSASRNAFDAHSGFFHGDHHANAYVYRWNSTGPWQPLVSLSKSAQVMPYSLEIADGQLFVGFADGSLYVSSDQGETWQSIRYAGDHINRISALVAVD
jgi:photosystem II stability/assembly factor-like uncharacterized protein